MANPIPEVHRRRSAYIRSLLAWHDLTRTDLADMIGCTQANISQKLLGQRQFSIDDLIAIADALDVDPRYLLHVPVYEHGLLRCTYRQLCWSEALFSPVELAGPGNSGLVPVAA